MSKKNIQMHVLGTNGEYEQIYPVPANHASKHAAGGTDAITPTDIGAVPTSRTVNGKALSANITLAASDVSAYSKSETDTLLQKKAAVGHTHDDRYYTESETDTLLANKAASNHTHTPASIGAYTKTEVDNLLLTASGIPSGIICMWSGTSNNIPNGWLLCDGNNGTPNLRDRFILGAGNSYAVGATGGEATHTLTVAEMPSHSHSVYAAYIYGNDTNRVSYGTEGGGMTVATSATGGGQPHNNMPPYYALCFIMKQ